MPKISAIIHTHNDGKRIGRTLESLRACDQVIVVDHGSLDETIRIAREHGADVQRQSSEANSTGPVAGALHDWILCLQPNESLSEGLEASLFEWKATEPGPAAAYSFAIREETEDGWRMLDPVPRLVNRKRVRWPGRLPASDVVGSLLPGELMRFCRP